MRSLAVVLACCLVAVTVAQQTPAATNPELAALITEAQAVRGNDWAPILAGLDRITRAVLDLDDQVDYDLLRSHARTRQWEGTDLRQWEVNAAGVINVGTVSGLFLRDGALPEVNVRSAIAQLRGLEDTIRANRDRLTTPARTWTENAQYQAYYARTMLASEVQSLEIANPALRTEFLTAAKAAVPVIEEHEAWLENVLLPRSTRAPTWTPEQIEFYQFVHEQLNDYGVDAMIRVAEAEDLKLWSEMEALAKRIHPSGVLRTAWEVMKDEAPPWEEVIPMAQKYVDLASDWLRGPGQHVVTIPDYLRYGARLSPPMARRTLSFGGATSGPTIDGRQSGFYILTPLEDRLTPEEKRSRLKS